MWTRLFLSLLIAAAAATAALAASTDGDRDRPLVMGRLHNAASTQPSRRASQMDVNRLKRLTTRPSVKCAKIEYVYQCLSSQNMTLTRANCRAGQTEASCCKGVRDYVNSNICGPIWNRYKRAGKTYYPGIWLCKCVETARTLKRLPKRPIRPR